MRVPAPVAISDAGRSLKLNCVNCKVGHSLLFFYAGNLTNVLFFERMVLNYCLKFIG